VGKVLWIFCKGIVLVTILGIMQKDNPEMIKYTCHLILQDELGCFYASGIILRDPSAK